MKASVGIVLLATVFVCSQVSAQKGTARCPPAKSTFGICTFDPNVNCLEDSECQGGQLCCADGCNKVCKDPFTPNEENPSPPPQIEIAHCPPAPKQAGICQFDEKNNCLEDNQCQNGQMCCHDGCNKVCKEPVRFQPIKPQTKPAFEMNKS